MRLLTNYLGLLDAFLPYSKLLKVLDKSIRETLHQSNPFFALNTQSFLNVPKYFLC
jgi:hypothetical protein